LHAVDTLHFINVWFRYLGKLDAQSGFMQGKLKIGGNMSFAMKLKDVIKSNNAKL